MFDVVRVRYVSNHTLWLKFEDGTEGEVNLSAELYGPVFEPLKDFDFFSRVYLNSDTGTIEWPNKADFAPEFLYERVHVTA